MSGYEPARYLDAAAAGLRALAAELDTGHGPRRGVGLRRVSGVPVVPVAVHDALCGWRVATPQPITDAGGPVMGCAGCGLGYTSEDALTNRPTRPGGDR